MTDPSAAREPAEREAPAGPARKPAATDEAAVSAAVEAEREADLLEGASAFSQSDPQRGGIEDPRDPAEAVAADPEEAALLRKQAALIGSGRSRAGRIVMDPASHRQFLVAAGIAMAVLVGVFLVLG